MFTVLNSLDMQNSFEAFWNRDFHKTFVLTRMFDFYILAFPSSCKRYTPYYTSFRIIMCLWGNPTSHIRCISSDCTFWERNCIIFVTKLSNIFYSHLKSQFIAFASFSRKVIFQGLTIVNELTSTF